MNSSFYSFITIKNIHWSIHKDFIVRISPWVIGVGGGRVEGVEPFSEGSYSRNLGQIGILGGNWKFGFGWFFSGGTWKFPVYIEVNEYES